MSIELEIVTLDHDVDTPKAFFHKGKPLRVTRETAEFLKQKHGAKSVKSERETATDTPKAEVAAIKKTETPKGGSK